MNRRWAWHCLAFLCCASFSLGVRAAGSSVLFVAREQTPFSLRMRAEIEAMGFETVTSDRLDPEGHSQAVAAAYVVETPPPRRVELWLKDVTGRLALNTVLQWDSDGLENDSGEGEQAVRASEQLRAFFQPLRESALPVVPEPSPAVEAPAVEAPAVEAPAVEAPAVEAPALVAPTARAPSTAEATRTVPLAPVTIPRVMTEVALARPFDAGSASLAGLVRGRAFVWRGVALGGVLVAPLSSAQVTVNGNAAGVSSTLLGAEASLLMLNASRFRVLGSAGVALAWLRVKGRAQAPYTSHTEHAFAVLPNLGLQGDLRLSSRWQLVVGGALGFSAPQLQVALAGEQIATFEHPLGLVSAGVGLDL